MTNNDQDDFVKRALRSLDSDQPHTPRPAFEEELWRSLSQTLKRRPPTGVHADESISESSDDDIVVYLGEVGNDVYSPRNPVGLARLAVAACVLVIGAIALFILTPDRESSLATEDEAPSVTEAVQTAPQPMSLAQACASYRDSGSTIFELAQEEAELSIESIASARAQLELLQTSLVEAGTLNEQDLTAVNAAISRLGQASLEFERNLISDARRTIASAQFELRFSEIESNTDCFGFPDEFEG